MGRRLGARGLRDLIEIKVPSLFEGLSKNWGLYQAKRGTSADGTVPDSLRSWKLYFGAIP